MAARHSSSLPTGAVLAGPDTGADDGGGADEGGAASRSCFEESVEAAVAAASPDSVGVISAGAASPSFALAACRAVRHLLLSPYAWRRTDSGPREGGLDGGADAVSFCFANATAAFHSGVSEEATS